MGFLDKLPVLSSLQWYAAAGVLAVACGAAGTAGYKTGAAFQAKTDNKALTEGIASANAAAKAAQDQADNQEAQYKLELQQRDKAKELADKLYDDLQKDAATTQTKLSAAQKIIKEIRNDPKSAAVLDTPLPGDLRQRVCSARGEACH